MSGRDTTVAASLSVLRLRRLKHSLQDLPIEPADIKTDGGTNCTGERDSHAAPGAQPMIIRTAATTTTMASDSGRKTFQPRRISWS